MSRLVVIGVCSAVFFCAAVTAVADDELPYYLEDRGNGIPLSMFGTYIEKGELIIYPFFEYYRDADAEYSPGEMGTGDDPDIEYRGKYRAKEGLLFIGYGVSDRLALELEAAVIDATLEKAAEDTSTLPDRITESGLGDVEGQIRWRWVKETEQRAGIFSYFETVFPLQKDNVLIGTTDWEFKLGTGVVKGFHWGTVTARLAAEYNADESALEFGEIALEYLKKVSSNLRVFAGVEGVQDEWELITEAQWHFSDKVFIKLNSAFGLTSKATDWAPEVGIVFRL